MTRRIDDYAAAFDVTDTLAMPVDAEPDRLRRALARVDLTPPAAEALRALGQADRLALEPTLLAADNPAEHVFGLVWRAEGEAHPIDAAHLHELDTPGHVKLIWDIRAQPGALAGSLLSTTTRLLATDEETRARLLAAWGIVGPLVAGLARRTLAAVRAHAEEGSGPPRRADRSGSRRNGARLAHCPRTPYWRTLSRCPSASASPSSPTRPTSAWSS